MMSDSQKLDWFDADIQRLEDVYWHMENAGGTVREAIDFLSDEEEADE